MLSGLLLVAVIGLIVLIVRWPDPPPDVQPPTPPGGLTLGATTCRSISLSWGPSTDDTDVVGYDVHQGGQVVASVGGDSRSADVAGVPGQAWELHVTARDAAGNASAAGGSVAVTPPQCGSDTTAPGAPAGVKATADGTSVTMSWAAATDDVAVAAYDVFRDGQKVGTVGGAGSLGFVDFGVAAATSHRYQVSARDGQGNTSSPSAAVDVTTGKDCTLLCAITPVARDTAVVFGLAQLPDGTVLYGRRDQREVVRLDPKTGQTTSLGQVPGAVSTGGDGGLLGIAVAPTYAKDRWVYLFFTTATDNRIVRLHLRGNGLDTGSMQSMLVGIPRGRIHNGGRLRFGPDGKLYAATGDAGRPRLAQDQSSLAGKVLRLNLDGTVPAGNPFGGYIWSFGYRNPLGMAFDSHRGLWVQEPGETTDDESNHVVKGGNYGWPACDGAQNAAGGDCDAPGARQPQFAFSVGEGGCGGVAIIRDVAYLACATGSRLWRLVLDGDTVTDAQALLTGAYGQLITVEPSADGTLWLAASTRTATGTETQLLRLTLPPRA
ncbi:hypothetical protein Cs7R123_01760 [Catellatospora sp. TT07R-123]|nr:hypothetical protein Cs7R123_01760 [Catellatospora sp. TT07R-123]